MEYNIHNKSDYKNYFTDTLMINQSRITMWLNQKILLWIFNFYEITVNKLFFGFYNLNRQISHITPNYHCFRLFLSKKDPCYSHLILTFVLGSALNWSAHYGIPRALSKNKVKIVSIHPCNFYWIYYYYWYTCDTLQMYITNVYYKCIYCDWVLSIYYLTREV